MNKQKNTKPPANARITAEQLTVGIIAGGKSRRFGTAKALALFRGKPMIDYALRLANTLSSRILLSIGEQDYLPGIDLPKVIDKISDCGPIGGVYSLLEEIDTPYLAVLPCDMPLLIPEVYQQLIAHAADDQPAAARTNRGLEPLASIWPLSARPALAERIRDGHLSLFKTLAALNAVEVDMEKIFPGRCRKLFANINRQIDLDNISAADLQEDRRYYSANED